MGLLAFAFILFAVLAQAFAAAETLYVRPIGVCANNGNGTAYSCASKQGGVGAYIGMSSVLYNLTDETVGQVDPGDTLYVCGAHTDQLIFGDIEHLGSKGSGIPSNIITVSWNCLNDPGSINSNGNYAFYTEQNYITLVNPVLNGGKFWVLSIGTFTGTPSQVRFVTILGGKVTNSLSAFGCVELRGRNITIDGLVVDNCAVDGIWGVGKFTTIRNTALTNISSGSLHGDCWQWSQEADGLLLEHNTCDHRNVDSKYCGIFQSNDNGFVTIRHNTCLRQLTDTVGAGIRLETSGAVLGNYVVGGQIGIHVMPLGGQTGRIAGNLVLGSHANGIEVGRITSSAEIVNNTIINTGTMRNGILMNTNSLGIRVINNIIKDAPIGINKNSVNNFDGYNWCDNTTTACVAIVGKPTTPGIGTQAGSVKFIDPLKDWRLAPSSLARQAGLSTTACFNFRGRACPLTPDIGAYQFSSGDPAASSSTP